MTKITPLSDLTSLTNETSAINTINVNNDRIETAIANTLSRDGSTPNTMEAQLDMNGYRIINHPAPVDDTDVATYGVIKDSLEDAETAAATATAQAVIATDQATISTTQAGISTAQAVIAVYAAEDAELFAQQVEDAKLIWQGTYAAGTTYNINDAVTYNGSSFICIQESTGNAPAVGGTAYWDDLANKGIDGMVTDGDYGDISVSGGVWSIDSGVIEGSNLADGDFGDFSVSSGVVTLDSGVVGSNELAAEAITGQTSATIASDDTLVFVDTTDGALKKDTVQGVVDVTTNQLFGGLTVTPTGTELLAVSDGTNVTAQSIADLASGGGLTFTYQDFQATTDTTYLRYYSTVKLADGKILQARSIKSTPSTIGLRILTVDTDGTITLGAETVLSGGANNLMIEPKYFTSLIALSENKVIIQYRDSNASSWKIALLTTDTTANTVTVENTYTVATNTASGYSTLRTQSARLSDTTAMLISGTNSTASSSNTVGRIVTLATPTTLTIGSAQNIETNAARNGQFNSALVQEPFSGDWIIMGYNQDLSEFCGISFTESSGTITGKTFARTDTIFGAQTQTQGMFAIPKKDAGFIFGMVNNGTAIAEGTGNVEMGVNRLNIFSPQYSKDATYWAGGGETNNSIVRIEDCIANNIPCKWADSVQSTEITQLTDDYYIVYNNGISSQYVLVINRSTGETNRIKLVTKNDLLTTNLENLSSITQVRDNQFLITTIYNPSEYINYQPFTIG